MHILELRSFETREILTWRKRKLPVTEQLQEIS